MRHRVLLVMGLVLSSTSAIANIQADIYKSGNQYRFQSEGLTGLFSAPDCDKYFLESRDHIDLEIVGATTDNIEVKTYSNLTLKIDPNRQCVIKSIDKIEFQPLAVEPAPAPVEMPHPAPPEPVYTTTTTITYQDFFSRQFTLNLADLPPIPNSTRPSAAIFLRNGANARKLNMAFCKGYVHLDTVEVVEAEWKMPEVKQVVTKMPLTKELPGYETDCDEILKVYDYDLAKSELDKLNPQIKYSNGPFIAIYNPNSSKVDQLIDMRGFTEEELERFGKNWHTVFAKANEQQANAPRNPQQPKGQFNIWGFLRDIFQASVCVTDPNLVYIFNEHAGKIADIVCKGTKES
ncbi:hypothetical protein [Acinetobacter higginsii]|uniref:hypothetical protein n=1 Tax=Acinetobacter higginsii TaxID=70347 RepID=UPI001F4AFCD7|nr:hypothetical protein [Acinetobacter higginsii]MCH7294087.1 hypothetical protein [Acinetobacter higginsii]